MTSCRPHTSNGPHSALCQADERAKGRAEVLQALRNFVVAQELEALADADPDRRLGRLLVIQFIRALIQVEEIKP